MNTVRYITTALFATTAIAPLGAMASPLTAQTQNACAIFVDRTWTVDPEHRIRAVHAVEDNLPSFVDDHSCDVLVLGQFADEGPWAPRRALAVPHLSVPDCTELRPPSLGSNAVLDNFVGFRDLHQDQARSQCDTARATARDRYQREMQAFLDSARVYLEGIQPTPKPTRTAIVGLLQPMLGAACYRAIAVLTDGIEEVQTPIPHLEVPANSILFLISIPASDTSGGYATTLSAFDAWRSAVPNVRIIPYTFLSSPDPWSSPPP